MPVLDESLTPVFEEVVRRNPGEAEFHQAVREVLESLGPVVAKHPEYADAEIIRRLKLTDPPERLDDLARDYHMTRDRVRQLEGRAMQRLRRRLLAGGFGIEALA